MFMAACLCLFPSVWGRKNSEKAGQIKSGSLCVHVSASLVCGLREMERMRGRPHCAVALSRHSVWPRLLSRLRPHRTTVIRPVWNWVLVTTLPHPPGPRMTNAVLPPQTEPIDCCVRGHIIPCSYWTGRGFIRAVSGCVESQQMTFQLWLVHACWTAADGLTNGYLELPCHIYHC